MKYEDTGISVDEAERITERWEKKMNKKTFEERYDKVEHLFKGDLEKAFQILDVLAEGDGCSIKEALDTLDDARAILLEESRIGAGETQEKKNDMARYFYRYSEMLQEKKNKMMHRRKMWRSDNGPDSTKNR